MKAYYKKYISFSTGLYFYSLTEEKVYRVYRKVTGKGLQVCIEYTSGLQGIQEGLHGFCWHYAQEKGAIPCKARLSAVHVYLFAQCRPDVGCIHAYKPFSARL
jgi:hypothetical protein